MSALFIAMATNAIPNKALLIVVLVTAAWKNAP